MIVAGSEFYEREKYEKKSVRFDILQGEGG